MTREQRQAFFCSSLLGLFFHLNRYSSLPLPGPKPVPPHAWVFITQDKPLRVFVGKFPGRNQRAALTDAPTNGVGVASRWLTDTRPVGFRWGLTGSHAFGAEK